MPQAGWTLPKDAPSMDSHSLLTSEPLSTGVTQPRQKHNLAHYAQSQCPSNYRGQSPQYGQVLPWPWIMLSTDIFQELNPQRCSYLKGKNLTCWTSPQRAVKCQPTAAPTNNLQLAPVQAACGNTRSLTSGRAHSNFAVNSSGSRELMGQGGQSPEGSLGGLPILSVSATLYLPA